MMNQGTFDQYVYRILFVFATAMLATGTVVYHLVERLGWLDAYYLSVITLTTVGYGDVTPPHAGRQALHHLLHLRRRRNPRVVRQSHLAAAGVAASAEVAAQRRKLIRPLAFTFRTFITAAAPVRRCDTPATRPRGRLHHDRNDP
jgi:hypothetical protein